MSVSFNGKPPIVVVSSQSKSAHPTAKKPINLEVLKGVFNAVLARTAGYQTAANKIEEATFSLVGNNLGIQTTLSPALLRTVFDGVALSLLEGTLSEYGHGNLKIKLMPATTEEKASSVREVVGSGSLVKLAQAATQLNAVSDQLTSQIAHLDATLKRLNLGVSAWVTVTYHEDEDGNCTGEDLGYVRIGSRWGIALRSFSGLRGDPADADVTFSAFADAPRQLRIRAVEFIPDLLEKLATEADVMIAKLSPKIEEISELTSVFDAFGDVTGGRDFSETARKTERSDDSSEVQA